MKAIIEEIDGVYIIRFYSDSDCLFDIYVVDELLLKSDEGIRECVALDGNERV
ncbi:MAG: hypothetical protein N2257_05460 [Thermodesulfovibrionales bacterium]|nr:hypothetical protein [Thermodesulfovibrionales bacterium]